MCAYFTSGFILFCQYLDTTLVDICYSDFVSDAFFNVLFYNLLVIFVCAKILQNVWSMPWKTWVAQFENYLVASGGTNYPVAHKKALLLHCLGKEGQRVFQNLPDHGNPPAGASECDKARLVLEKHFGPKINVVAERYKFRQRAQLPGETAQDYVAALRELAVTCNFGAMHDQETISQKDYFGQNL